MTAKRITTLGLLTACAVVAHLLESMFPPIIPAIPGAKLGLANIFALVALVRYTMADAMSISVARCFMGLLFSGSVLSLLYSLAGAMLSTLAMWGAWKILREKLSLYGVSIIGAIFHNLGQICVACCIMNPYVLAYLPYMLLLSLPAGLFTGLVAMFCKKALEKIDDTTR